MPILPGEVASAAEAVEGSDFEPLPPGVYYVRLIEVEGGKSGPAGEYWTWTVEVVEPSEHAKRRCWINTSLSEKALWKLKETFHAFGYDTSSDTDEMVGRAYAKAKVVNRPIQQGERTGEMRHEVDGLTPVEDSWAPDGPPDEEPF